MDAKPRLAFRVVFWLEQGFCLQEPKGNGQPARRDLDRKQNAPLVTQACFRTDPGRRWRAFSRNQDPQAWLANVLARIADHPASRIDELLPWNWRPAETALGRAA